MKYPILWGNQLVWLKAFGWQMRPQRQRLTNNNDSPKGRSWHHARIPIADVGVDHSFFMIVHFKFHMAGAMMQRCRSLSNGPRTLHEDTFVFRKCVYAWGVVGLTAAAVREIWPFMNHV